MDPAVLQLIVSGLINGIKAIDAMAQAKGGYTEDQRSARRLLRKEIVQASRDAAVPLETPAPLDGD